APDPRCTQRRCARRGRAAAGRPVRALALDRAAGPGAAAVHLAGAAEARHGAHRGPGGARGAARADPGPPRAGRQGDGEQDLDQRVHPGAGQGGADRLHAGGVRHHPETERRVQREVRLPVHPGRARAARHRAGAHGDHRDLRAAAGEPARRGAGRMPAQHPPHRGAAAERQVRRRTHGRRAGLGPAGGAGPVQRPGLQGAGAAHRHLPDRRAPGGRRAHCAGHARGRLRRSGDRRGGQRGGSLPGTPSPQRSPRGRGSQGTAHRLALRHRAQRRQVRRAAGHLCPPGLRARALAQRPAAAVRPRGDRLRRRGRPALQGHLPGLRCADRQFRSGLAGPAGRRRHLHARGDAARRTAGHAGGAHRPAARPVPLPRLRGGPHRAGAGADRDGPAAGRGDVHQRRRALRVRGAGHGQPRRHHADGPAARRRRRGVRRARRHPAAHLEVARRLPRQQPGHRHWMAQNDAEEPGGEDPEVRVHRLRERQGRTLRHDQRPPPDQQHPRGSARRRAGGDEGQPRGPAQLRRGSVRHSGSTV
ncbi:MAG: 2-oxo-4-hydroxy-4-carboxy-5-ureidoimidazoline (OHCU) decarboxylase / Allantoate amidohydrolase, partial [uncultured Ramlibacter sp.]